MDVHADFHSFWMSAEAALAGENIYDTGARLVNLNPPFWTLVVLPFGFMEALDAYRLFVLVMVFTMLFSLAWMAEELRLRAGWAVVAAGVVLLSSPMLATLALGQMYPVLALGLVAAWTADRRGRYLLSGLVLGVGNGAQTVARAPHTVARRATAVGGGGSRDPIGGGRPRSPGAWLWGRMRPFATRKSCSKSG